jgi:DNA-binding NarL/FixJ family response regulator
MASLPVLPPALVLEDHPIVADFLALSLRTMGVPAVHVAGSVADGLALTARYGIGIAVVDWALPVASGLQYVRPSSAAGVRCLVITGLPTLGLVREVMAAGAVGVVTKQGPSHAINRTLRALLAGGDELYDEVTRGMAARQLPAPARDMLGAMAIGQPAPRNRIRKELAATVDIGTPWAIGAAAYAHRAVGDDMARGMVA